MPIRSILLHNALIVRTQASDKMHFAPRISDFFFGGVTDEMIPCLKIFFPVCGSTFTFVFVSQWATTVLGIMEKVELDRNALYLHLPQLHVQSRYLSLSVWHVSWIAALPPQKMQHQERLQQQKTTNQRSPLLLQVLPSFNYLGGHLVQDQHRHLLHAKKLKEAHLLWHQLQDVSHSSDQEHLDSLLRFKKQQWQLSLPSSQHWKLFLDILFEHMSISCCHIIALYQRFWRLMTRLKRTFRLQTLPDLPKKKVFFLGGRMLWCSLWQLFLHVLILLLHSRDCFSFHHVLLQAQTTLTFLIGSTLRSSLDGRRISGSPTTVPHSRPYQRSLESFGLWLHFDFRTCLLIYANAGPKQPTFTSTRRRRHYIARVRKTPSTLVQMQLYSHVSSYPSSSNLPSYSSCYTFTFTSQFFIQLARNLTSEDKLWWCGSNEAALWEELPRRSP